MLRDSVWRTKRSVLTSWLISYAIALLLPITIASLVYYRTVDFVSDEVGAANRATLNQVRDDIDRQFDVLNRLVLELSLSGPLRTLMRGDPPLDDYERFRIGRVLEELRLYAAVAEFVDYVYIFLHRPQFYLTQEAYRTPPQFLAIEGEGRETAFASWQDLMKAEPRNGVVPVPVPASVDNAAAFGTAYVQSIPLTADSPKATVVFILDMPKCTSAVQAVSMLNSGRFVISDPDGDELYVSDFGDRHETREGEEVVSYTTDSRVADMRYTFLIPETVFWEKSRYIRNLTLLSIVASVILCAPIAYVFARRNYSPVHDIVRTLVGRDDVDGNRRVEANEFEFIQTEITQALSENDEYRHRIENQKVIIRSRKLTDVLRGRIELTEKASEDLRLLGLDLSHQAFGVYCFRLEGPGPLEEDGRKTTGAERMSQIEYMMALVAESENGTDWNGHFTEVNGISTVLVCLRSANHARETLLRTATNTKSKLENLLACEVTVGMSRLHRDKRGLPRAFEEAAEALEYSLVLGTGIVIPDASIGERRHSYEYPLAMEEQLVNTIRIGGFKAAVALVDEVLDMNTRNSRLSADGARCLMFDLTGSIVKAVHDIEADGAGSLLEEIRPISTITHADSLSLMRERLVGILRTVCVEVETRKRSHNVELRDRVSEFLEEHLDDPSLNTYAVADAFDMDAGYLSRFFKEQQGSSIPAYIRKRRFEKAKKLLRDPSNPVKAVSKAVGYPNSSVFVRAFRKSEGVTPGQFQALLAERHSAQ
jgi:AraC-like DNA-binding protein